MIKNQSREDLRNDILLTLGEPYIKVNLSTAMLDQAINTALKYFFKSSPYGSFESHYCYTVTATDVTNGYIPVPSWIDSVVSIIRQGYGYIGGFMTVEYQMARDLNMSMMNHFNSVSLVDYVCMQQQLQNMEDVLSQPMSFTYVRYQRRLIPDFNYWEGDVIAMKCYENVDPESAADGNPNPISADDLWNDETLKALAVACAKQAWGGILKKFGGVVLPGGITLDGKEIAQEGKDEIRQITEQMLYSNPPCFMMG